MQKDTYNTILAVHGDYTLIMYQTTTTQHNVYQPYQELNPVGLGTPYIVAWLFDPESGTWQQGHYYNTLLEAVTFLNQQKA